MPIEQRLQLIPAFCVFRLLHGVIMRLSLLLFLFIFLQQPTPSARKVSEPNQQPTRSQQTSAPDQRGTEQSPLVVKTLPIPKTQEEAAQDTQDRKDRASNDRHIIWFTGALVVIGFLQFLVYAYQAKKLRETVESAEEQSQAMERHIGEATRSANAMENIARVIESGNKGIMRAYLGVTVGTALYQERRGPGQPDVKFEARPNLVNSGMTPARQVRIRIKVAILPMPMPTDFTFPLPEEKELGFGGIVPAHQTNIIFGSVDDFVPDDEVQTIKEGSKKALVAWGLVTYEDIFGDPHHTRFGQIITWQPNNTVLVYFIPGQNDSD